MTDQNQTPRTRKPRGPKAAATDPTPTAPVAPPTEAPDTKPAPAISKQAQLAALVTREEGATLDQMIELTGWLPHTTRAAMTGLKKKGYAISSDKVDGVRTYRAVAPGAN